MININFDKFNKVGLKAVLDKFNKADLTVADVVADNKAKRESGFQVKTAAINFESGQKLIVKAKAGGSIFQVKLNNKVLPIKHVEDLDKAVDEVISYVKENEKNYEKQLARQKVKVPTIKVANASVAEQITQYQTTVDETTAANEELKVQVDAAVTVRAPKDAEAATLETELKDLETAGEALQKKYDQLKEAA